MRCVGVGGGRSKSNLLRRGKLVGSFGWVTLEKSLSNRVHKNVNE